MAEEATGSITIAQLQAQIGGNAAQFLQVAQEVKSQLTQMQGQMNSVGQTDVFGGFLKADLVTGALRTAGDALSGLVRGVGEVVGQGFEAVKTYETMTRSLTQLTATQLVQNGVTTDMGQALALAAQPAQDLLNWVEQLAIHSPFNMDDVENVLRMAEAFGFGQAEAQRLTKDLVDFAAGAGLTQDAMTTITRSMGQIEGQGKVTSREMLELANVGLPIRTILADALGVSTANLQAMVTKGLVPAGEAIRAVEGYLEKDFAGAAQRATNTWQGLTTSLQDIKEKDLRGLFSGMFAAVQPEAAQIVNWLGSDAFYGKLQEIGQGLGEGVKAGLQEIKLILAAATGAGGPLAGLKDALKLNLDTEGVKGALVGVVTVLATSVVGALGVIEKAALVVEDTIDGISAHWHQVMDPINQAQDWLTQASNTLETGWLKLLAGGQVLTHPEFYNASNAQQGWQGEFQKYYDQLAQMADVGPGGATVSAGKGLVDQWADVDAQLKPILASILAAEQQVLAPQLGPASPTLPQVPGGWGGFLQVGQPLQNPAVQAALNAPLADTGAATSGAVDAFTKQVESAFKTLADKITGMLGDVAKQVAKMVPGLAVPGSTEPGANSWAEPFYRIADVAAHYKDRGKDTAKWEQMYFPGMTADQAGAAAKGISGKVAAGNWLDPSVFGKVDWQAVGNDATAQLQNSKTQQYMGQAAAGLMAAGKPLTAENMKAMIDQLAAADKDSVVPSLKDIQGAVEAMGTNVTGGSNLKDVVAAVNALQKPAAAPPPPPSQTAPPAPSAPAPATHVPGGGYASGTASALEGFHWVGEQGPELTYTPPGMRIWSAPASRQAAGGGDFLAGLLQAVNEGSGDVAAAGKALGRTLVDVTSNQVLGGMLAHFEGRLVS